MLAAGGKCGVLLHLWKVCHPRSFHQRAGDRQGGVLPAGEGQAISPCACWRGGRSRPRRGRLWIGWRAVLLSDVIDGDNVLSWHTDFFVEQKRSYYIKKRAKNIQVFKYI